LGNPVQQGLLHDPYYEPRGSGSVPPLTSFLTWSRLHHIGGMSQPRLPARVLSVSGSPAVWPYVDATTVVVVVAHGVAGQWMLLLQLLLLLLLGPSS